MNYQIEQYIPNAMIQLEEYKASISDDNKAIPKEFNSYISSFGISVLQNGLIPTSAIYSNTSNTDRAIVLNWMYKILNINSPHIDNLFEYVLVLRRENESDLASIEAKLLNISIALKLCIRTFETTK